MQSGMSIAEFLSIVVTAPEGNFVVGAGDGVHWNQDWFTWPSQQDEIADRVTALAQSVNTYFSAYLFSERNHARQYVLPTNRTITSDLDEANVDDLPLTPTVLLGTSAYKHHGFWTIREPVEPDVLEILSRKLTYAIPLADRSGWPLGRFVRFPNTFNFKYPEGPQPVVVRAASLNTYDLRDLELLHDAPPSTLVQEYADFIEVQPELDVGPRALLAEVAHLLPAKVVAQYDQVMPDRSTALWLLMTSAFRAGLHRDQVYWLARYSANNKFAGLAYFADRELAKDVLRAERVAAGDRSDIRGQVQTARRLPGPVSERRQHMTRIITNHMQDEGIFARTLDDSAYYVRHDLGRPIYLGAHSEWLNMLLDVQYGLNATETDTSYAVAALCAYARNVPAVTISAALSWYHQDSDSLLLHTGKKDVLRISAQGIEYTTNGAYGVVFPWTQTMEPFSPQLGSELGNGKADNLDWANILFRDSLDRVVEMTPIQAQALLKTWTIFVLMRNAAISRPILALFGQPGAGKSALFRKIYAFFYGPNRSLASATNPENFDQAVSRDPLVVLDNVDSWEKWLPDRLALSASSSDIDKRKLYTDADTFILKRQAMVGLTAHNPRFGREDVMDRLLLLTLGRLPDSAFKDEAALVGDIVRRRNYLWGAVVQDIQRVLATPLPTQDEAPPFRVQDFARFGLRIARALGHEAEFREALACVRVGTRTFILEEEAILVDAIRGMLSRPTYVPEWRSVAAVFAGLEEASDDPIAFAKYYRNAIQLGKKLWVLHTSLRDVFDIEWKYDVSRGARVWRIAASSQQGGAT
jgi:hypothetical protein